MQSCQGSRILCCVHLVQFRSIKSLHTYSKPKFLAAFSSSIEIHSSFVAMRHSYCDCVACIKDSTPQYQIHAQRTEKVSVFNLYEGFRFQNAGKLSYFLLFHRFCTNIIFPTTRMLLAAHPLLSKNDNFFLEQIKLDSRLEPCIMQLQFERRKKICKTTLQSLKIPDECTTHIKVKGLTWFSKFRAKRSGYLIHLLQRGKNKLIIGFNITPMIFIIAFSSYYCFSLPITILSCFILKTHSIMRGKNQVFSAFQYDAFCFGFIQP